MSTTICIVGIGVLSLFGFWLGSSIVRRKVVGLSSDDIRRAHACYNRQSQTTRLAILKKFYLGVLVEDPQDGTEFDCAVLDAIEGLEKTFGSRPYEDNTPCLDGYGDRSTIGFERLWHDFFAEAMKPPPPFQKTHQWDPRTQSCFTCGLSEIEIIWGKIRCAGSPRPSSSSGS